MFFESKYSVSVNNIDRQTVHREGAATQTARMASSVRVLGTIRCGVLLVGASVTGCDRSAVNLGTVVMTSNEP